MKTLPRLNEKLIKIISEYEAQCGEIVIDGKRMILELQYEIQEYRQV